MEPSVNLFQKTTTGGASIRATNITTNVLTIPEDDAILHITPTILTESISTATGVTITPFDTRSQESFTSNATRVSPRMKLFGNKFKRQISAVRTAAPQYFQTLRPALSVKSIDLSWDATNSRLSYDDIDLEQDWLSDDADSEEETNTDAQPQNINATENSALTLYKQGSLQSNASSTDYQTFNPLLLGMTSVSGVGYKNFLRQHTIEDSMTAVHRKKKKRIRKLPTTPHIKLQPTPSTIILKAPKPKMGKYATIFCIVNVYVNNTMLYNPYAFMKGGLVSILIYGLICLYLCYCAKLVIKLFQRPELHVNHRTFPGVAGQGYGWSGQIIVSLAIILENIGRTMIGVITLWSNVMFLIKYEIVSPEEKAMIDWDTWYIWIGITSTIAILPCVVFFVYLADMYAGGVLVFLSTSLLSILIILNFATMGSVGYDEINILPANWNDLALGIGIFVANLAGHACLPSIYSQMENPKEFDNAINISWIIIFFIQVLTGIIGYLTFGEQTGFIITHAMIEYGGNHILTVILIVILCMNLYFHIPIGVIISSELPENTLQIKHVLIRRIFHIIWFFIIVSIAWLLIPDIAILSAVIGSLLTTTISIVCPLLFQLHLDKERLNEQKCRQWTMRLLVAFTIILAIALCYVDVSFRESQRIEKKKWM